MRENGSDKRVICAQVDGDTVEALERLAAREERTLSGEIRLALREHISRRPVRVHAPDHDLEEAA
jgi:predicted transcriptional regulator